jgi:hypothetical protein
MAQPARLLLACSGVSAAGTNLIDSDASVGVVVAVTTAVTVCVG